MDIRLEYLQVWENERNSKFRDKQYRYDRVKEHKKKE